MEITTTQVEGRVPVTILKPSGSIDGSNYQILIDEAKAVCKAGAHNILLDMADTEYMSSAGLVAMQSIIKLLQNEELPDPEEGWAAMADIDRTRESGQRDRFKLVNVQPRVDKSLEQVGFKNYIAIFDDLDEAVASFPPLD
jgi:anti-anti-sigma factor